MSFATSERKVKGFWLATIADEENLAEVTVAEIEAGVNITPVMPTAGFAVGFTQNNASTPMLDSGQIAKAPGTSESTITLTSLRDDEEEKDLVWETFAFGLTGFLVVSRFGPPVAGSAGPPVVPASRIEVYACASHEPIPIAPTQDDFQQSSVELLPSRWNLRATVAAA